MTPGSASRAFSEDRISVVVPVYNCADCLRPLCQRLTETLQALGVDYEIILVDDRGRDNAWAVICDLASAQRAVRGIRLSRNFGQHAAITAGVGRARGSHVVVMDCDLQDPPEVIPELYARAVDGAEVVFARRRQRGQTWSRRLASALYFRFLNLVGAHRLEGEYGALSMISRKVADAFLGLHERDRQYIWAIQWLGFDTAVVDYDQPERTIGKSAYTFSRLMRQAVIGALFQTTAFLRWIVYAGFFIAFIGFVAALYRIYAYFAHHVQPGWTSVVVLELLMGGFILVAIGVVGLYIGRIFEQVRGRPVYVVDEETGTALQGVPLQRRVKEPAVD